MFTASRRLRCRPDAPAAVFGALLRSALVPRISTGFREERDTFGPINVPSDRLWGAQSLQNFDIGDEREQMPEPIIRVFGVLKKCAAKVDFSSLMQHDLS